MFSEDRATFFDFRRHRLRSLATETVLLNFAQVAKLQSLAFDGTTDAPLIGFYSSISRLAPYKTIKNALKCGYLRPASESDVIVADVHRFLSENRKQLVEIYKLFPVVRQMQF